jgi:hypothetical protein
MKQEWHYWNETNKSGVTGLNQTSVTFLECNKQEWCYWKESNKSGIAGMNQTSGVSGMKQTRVALLEGIKQVALLE